ncbi:hypothetical protein DV515_00011206 [Chloebia gouldiae]|uniref:Uncharacterized protein n=1 Tax=Chloebia gouldiae TaxID=44316 RepID=A0A3L8S857_CHLGU|nr:hypothetical protein DV515_00011206 [Chloebia gouldiae]
MTKRCPKSMDRSLPIGALGAAVLPVAARGVRVPDADGVTLSPERDTIHNRGLISSDHLRTRDAETLAFFVVSSISENVYSTYFKMAAAKSGVMETIQRSPFC